MAFLKIKTFLQNLKKYESLNQFGLLANKTNSLEHYLESIESHTSLEERIDIIITIIRWLNSVDIFQPHPEQVSISKIRSLFNFLDNNPEKKEMIKKIFTTTLQELNSTEFFCEVGLPSNIGLIGELIEKVTIKILPRRPIGNQLSELMITLFPDEADVEWLKALDQYCLERLPELFEVELKEEQIYGRLKNDIDDSLIYLVSQITAIGLSPAIRKRIPHRKMKALPFYSLPSKLNLYLKTRSDDTQIDLNKEILVELNELLEESKIAINDVYHHLNSFGVSTHLVFQLEKTKLFIERVVSLLELTNSDKIDTEKVTKLISELVEQNLHQRHALSIFSDNATLLAQKIVENNSQTGEHYIAKDRSEHLAMIKSAMGGGFLTAFTVYVKTFIGQMGLSQFFYGAFSAINYSGSFLFIQFCGFTLATKQPAATASALAQKLEKIEDRENIITVTDEIVNITRTQIAAVFGNLIAVIPTVVIISLIWQYFTGGWIITNEAANYTLKSTDIFGPSIIYAAFTGFLLWLSSVVAGWAMNWYSFHQLSYLLSNNKKLNFVFGSEGTLKLSNFLEHGITGIVGSISLGVFLGIFPEMLNFFGVPLEVRHVTLSTGALAAAIPTLGVEMLRSTEFLRAALGICLIGFLNLTVSFTLALTVAFRAKKISTHRKILIYQSVLSRFIQNPISFFIPKS